MRKMQKALMLVAAAAMALAGCSKEDVSDNAQFESGLRTTRGFTAEIASSRTAFNDAATNLEWTAGDRLGFYTDVATDLNVASSTYAEGATNFTAEIDTKATNVYAYYPYNAGQSTSYGYTSTNLPIEQSQTQTEAGILAGEYVPMSAAATLVEGQNTVLTFTPVASLIAFDIYDADNNGDQVKSITFTPAGGVKINGNRYIDMTTGNATATSPTGYYTSATVTLTTPYAVPAAKPADKTGYIYLAVTPKSYAGGTFTVKTDKGSYDFVTATAIDASNVYAPITIPMNLAKVRQPAPTVTHVFYDDFSKATGTSGIDKLYASPTDYAYYYTDPYTNTGGLYGFNGAIRVGVSGTTGTVTTPALKLIEGTKNLKVTFYANGWKADQALNVTASTGTVVGGSDLVMPAATATGSGVMDKSEAALFTVYVENADATTALTFALNGTTIDRRFILDDLTVDVHDGPIVLTPVILADDITGVAAAGVTDATFTFDIRNDNNYTASVEYDGAVVTAASVENATKTITYSVSENTDTANERSGWITITLNDTESKSLKVIVSQNKKIVAGVGKYMLVAADQADWSGKYLIAYKNATVRLLHGKGAGDYAAMDAELSSAYFEGDDILSIPETDACACTIEKTANGYSIKCSAGFMGMTKSANNLWFNSTVVEKQYEWTISYNSDKVEIVNVSFTDRYLQANAGSPRFAGYRASSKMQPITLYKYTE